MNVRRRNIFAHRGLWESKADQNSESAICAALRAGYSVEIDIRDSLGSIVVSHDVPKDSNQFSLDSLRRSISELGPIMQNQILALNVKSDGLHSLFDKEPLLPIHYFFFDMSVPENFVYTEILNLETAIRISDYEPKLVRSTLANKWIWLDSFHSEWWLEEESYKAEVLDLTQKNKVVIVSPELHSRNPEKVWDFFVENVRANSNLYLCTDYPSRIEEISVNED